MSATAAQTTLTPLLVPRSVAVVGASRDPKSVGHRALTALVGAGFSGRIVPVNPAASELAGMKVVPSIRDVAGQIDLAIIAVPAPAVPRVIDDCGAAAVRGVIVLTAGFSEACGPDGDSRQAALVKQVHAHSMRMIGPNCIGVVNTALNFNGSFSPVFPPAGRIALASQSGAVGITTLAQARARGIGLSTFVSLGNSADVSTEDLLEYWAADPRTDVVMLYLESLSDPTRFARIASAMTPDTPIVAIKAGRSAAGSRAASSHTAAMATPDVAVDALFHQAGVIRAESIDEMFDIAMCLEREPLPAGRRVAIITNAGGPGILAADACARAGLTVTPLSDHTRSVLAAQLPPLASIGNPIDMVASAGGLEYRNTIHTVLDSGEIDAVLVIVTPIDVSRSQEILDGIRDGVAATQATRPVLLCLMPPADEQALRIGVGSLPTYAFPEQAVRALASVARYADWKRQPHSAPARLDDMQLERLHAIRDRARVEHHDGWLAAEDVHEVLAAAGISAIETIGADSGPDAVAAAAALGYPVALKLRSAVASHKTELGGVRLNLRTAGEVTAAFEAIATVAREKLPPGGFEGVVVQRMAPRGVEVIVGATRDPRFGPLIGVGLGGTGVELLGDTRFRLAPLTGHDIDAMLHETRAFRVLQGFRGAAPGDVAALRDIVARIAQLTCDFPELAELDLNPVIVLPAGRGCVVADARIRLQH